MATLARIPTASVEIKSRYDFYYYKKRMITVSQGFLEGRLNVDGGVSCLKSNQIIRNLNSEIGNLVSKGPRL